MKYEESNSRQRSSCPKFKSLGEFYQVGAPPQKKPNITLKIPLWGINFHNRMIVGFILSYFFTLHLKNASLKKTYKRFSTANDRIRIFKLTKPPSPTKQNAESKQTITAIVKLVVMRYINRNVNCPFSWHSCIPFFSPTLDCIQPNTSFISMKEMRRAGG